jgi:hypothetical protein
MYTKPLSALVVRAAFISSWDSWFLDCAGADEAKTKIPNRIGIHGHLIVIMAPPFCNLWRGAV